MKWRAPGAWLSASTLSRLTPPLLLPGAQGLRCREPYSYLFPGGEIQSFEDAMLPQYDAKFATLPKFGFQKCINRYVPANELSFYRVGAGVVIGRYSSVVHANVQ